MCVFDWVNSEAVYSVKLLHFVVESMWSGSSVDKAVRPRNELLLLIEQQKKEIERQQRTIDQQQQDLAAIQVENRRQQRIIDQQQQHLAAIQVENICLLGENTDLKKRKRADL